MRKNKLRDLAPKKRAALINTLISIIIQAFQYAWYFIIIDSFPNLGRLVANRYILTASTLIQLACTSVFNISAMTKKWSEKFAYCINYFLLALALLTLAIDASYAIVASIETFGIREITWPQFNQTVLITETESLYQGASIAAFALQALVYDTLQIFFIVAVFRHTFRCRSQHKDSIGFGKLNDDSDSDTDTPKKSQKENITMVIEK
jgi:multidrug transporter EmrE-like cation transporter